MLRSQSIRFGPSAAVAYEADGMYHRTKTVIQKKHSLYTLIGLDAQTTSTTGIYTRQADEQVGSWLKELTSKKRARNSESKRQGTCMLVYSLQEWKILC